MEHVAHDTQARVGRVASLGLKAHGAAVGASGVGVGGGSGLLRVQGLGFKVKGLVFRVLEV